MLTSKTPASVKKRLHRDARIGRGSKEELRRMDGVDPDDINGSAGMRHVSRLSCAEEAT